MNINKFTQKSLQAVQDCEKVALEYGNQEIEQEHLLYALLVQDDSLILKLMEKMGIDKNAMVNRVEEAIRKRTKVQGGQQYVGQDLNKALIHAEDEAKQMGDEYVSVEHLFLSMIKYPNKEVKTIFREMGVKRDDFLQVLSTVRGNQRVTSDNPEDTYDTLNKYGSDLVERARDQKLDPVIGRDAEIRNLVRILSRKTKNLSLIHILLKNVSIIEVYEGRAGMKKYDELSNKEKHNFEEFLITTFKFSEDELAAIDKQKPMTMELFSSCLAKCTEWGLYKLFERLLDEYPDLMDKYVKAIDEDIKDVVLPERTPEEEEESWNRLCERIKNEYGDDLTCE